MNRPAPYIPDEQRARQAVASLGGYAHQLIVTLLAWMELGDGDTLLVEVAEDYAVVGSGVLDMTQVKRETTGTPLTLRRPDARKAILSLWQFGEANPDIRISLHFLTTAPAGHERGAAFPGGATGVEYWARAAIGQDISPVRAYLLELEWPHALATFLAQADDETLRARLLRPLVWTTGADQTRTALDVLSDRLALRAIADDLMPSDGERALPLLLLDLLRLVLEEDRRVDRLAFERAWERATTVPMPLSAVRQMRGAAPPTLPDFFELSPDPLPRRHSTRREAVDRLAEICGSGTVPWIHGSSGLGKSRLATLLAAKLGGAWHFVRMRGMSPAETAATLRKAVAGLTRQGLVGVVLDDLPVTTAGAWEKHLRSLATETARLGLHLVVTSERRPLTTASDEFDPWRVEAAPASYLTVDETAEIVAAAGGDPGQWASILHLTCGGGHPLFVDARVVGLASRDWPRSDMLAGLVDGGASAEVVEVRAGIALRLLDELDPDAHVLLLRLATLVGAFDRELAMAVAEAYRPLPRPGVLLDYLIGPWIESAGGDRLKLSPLLATADAAGLGDVEREAVRNAVVEHLTSRRPLNAFFLSQLLIQAAATRNVRGLSFVAGAILTAKDRSAVASACVALPFLSSKKGRLVPENLGVSATLRLAQVIATLTLPNPTMLDANLAAADAEFARMPDPASSASRYTMLLAVLTDEDAEVPPPVWVPRLLDYVSMVERKEVPAEMLEGMGRPDLGGLIEDQFFFLVRTNRIGDLQGLGELFRLLESVEPDRRRSWLAAATTLLGGPPLFIQGVWTKLATSGQLDATAALDTYRRLATIADGWGERTVAIECHRAAAVMLDEYLHDQEGALHHLDFVAAKYAAHPAVARTRAGVLAHAGRHAEASSMLARIRDDYSPDEPLERTLMLVAAASSTARSGDRRAAAALFLEAHDASEKVKVLDPGVRVGLLCDAAVEFGAAGDWEAALGQLGEVHLAAEALPENPSERSWLAIQAVTQVAQWLKARHEGRTALLLEEHPGTWSLLEPTLPDDRTGAVGLDTALSMAALLEFRLGRGDLLTRRFQERELQGKVTPLSSVALRGGQLAALVDQRDVQAFVALLPTFVAAGQAALQAKVDGLLHLPTTIGSVPAAEWNDAGRMAAHQAMSELLAETILDRDPVALESTHAQIEAIERDLDNVQDPATDYITTALDGLAWLASPGHADPASLVHVGINLTNWLTVCTRPSLSARVWRELRDAWADICRLAPSERGALALGDLPTLVALEEGGMPEVARLTLAGAEVLRLPLHSSTSAMLEARAGRR